MWKVVLLALLAASSSPSVSVYPVSGIAPLTVRIRTTIPKDAENRSACLFVVSDVGEESESCWTLDGDRAAISTTRYLTLSQGAYEVGLIIERATSPREVSASREKVTVLGFNQ